MKIKATPEEILIALTTFASMVEVKLPVTEEDNKYTEAVGKAIAEQVEVKPKKKRKVDVGKVMSLYDAKWPISKIADEMKCHEQTVRNIVKEALSGKENSKA